MRLKRFSPAAAFLIAVCASVAAAVSPPISRGDVHWLDRVTFGINTPTVARYRQLGREKFLDEQLQATPPDPQALAAEIAAIPVTQRAAADVIKTNRAEQQRINALTNEEEKQQGRRVLNQAGNEVVYETMKRHLTRAVESPWQLREQMTWFWMNHFSVFQGKANIRWTLAEYEDTVRT